MKNTKILTLKILAGIDTHEQARGSLTIQASLDLKLGEYNLKKGKKSLSFYIHPRASTWYSTLRVFNSNCRTNWRDTIYWQCFLGNPISASSADKVIKQYIENNYPLFGLKEEKALKFLLLSREPPVAHICCLPWVMPGW